ncbi:hypothetical protein TRFO_13007 [Tritrichomonas foetus]|uniref:Initiator binding domain-containing protein n=1 Tax=Tritrichomonas foetus TaxID=1144522 RepID=A0A1J4L0W8_9EUKA|nr:hypothetical protein TRFO_13007 [Tritrichomonas foetus]|eukprot:OHT16736.1 hypothetical protein TRFO_13007 [Tritrichomonas foetus]
MAMQFAQNHGNFPKFFFLLSDSDRLQYISIRDAQRDPHNKTETFAQEIEKLRKFVVRGDCEDWKRSLVCGIYWLQEGLAINIQQLKVVLSKCKSSLNASLSKIGLNVILNRAKAAYLVLNTFPFLKDHSSELRQWTVRKRPPPSALPLPAAKETISQAKESKNICQFPILQKVSGNTFESVLETQLNAKIEASFSKCVDKTLDKSIDKTYDKSIDLNIEKMTKNEKSSQENGKNDQKNSQNNDNLFDASIFNEPPQDLFSFNDDYVTLSGQWMASSIF